MLQHPADKLVVRGLTEILDKMATELKASLYDIRHQIWVEQRLERVLRLSQVEKRKERYFVEK